MTRAEFSTSVDVPHAPKVAFTYLVDPRNRPEWQASLVSVRLDRRDEQPAVGMGWRDTMVVGVKPRMEITELVPYRVFTERGSWGGISMLLTLTFVATGNGCRIRAEGRLEGSGLWAAPVRAGGFVASRSIRSDLERASRVLTDRGLR
ncbi:MAG: SRPBCC family protein [Nocardioides sp.]